MNETIEPFLDYFERVRERTRRVILCVPPEQLEWTHKEGAFTFGDLIRHLGAIERWMFAENARDGRAGIRGMEWSWRPGMRRAGVFRRDAPGVAGDLPAPDAGGSRAALRDAGRRFDRGVEVAALHGRARDPSPRTDLSYAGDPRGSDAAALRADLRRGPRAQPARPWRRIEPLASVCVQVASGRLSLFPQRRSWCEISFASFVWQWLSRSRRRRRGAVRRHHPAAERRQPDGHRHPGDRPRPRERSTTAAPTSTAPTGEDRKGKIWGGLVPYGMANLGFGACGDQCPWRGGANENTVFTTSHDIKVAGPAAAGGLLRAPLHPRQGRVDGHLLQELHLLGELLLRRQGGCAARPGQAREERVPRVADLRVHRPPAGPRHARAAVGGPPAPPRHHGRQRRRPLRRRDLQPRAALEPRLLLAELGRGGAVLPGQTRPTWSRR